MLPTMRTETRGAATASSKSTSAIMTGAAGETLTPNAVGRNTATDGLNSANLNVGWRRHD